MMKNILVCLLAAGLGLLPGVSQSQDAALFFEQIETVSNTTTTMPLKVDFSAVQGGVGAFDLYIGYDPDVLTYTGHENVDASIQNMYVIDRGPGLIYVMWMDFTLSKPSLLQGKLMDLVFSFSDGFSDVQFLQDGNTQSMVSDAQAMPLNNVSFTDGAIYTKKPIFVSLSAEPSQIGALLSGAGRYEVSDTVRINTTEVEGYHFVGWISPDPENMQLLEDSSALAQTFLMPERSVSFTASYEPIPYSIALLTEPEIPGSDTILQIQLLNRTGDSGILYVGDEVSISVQEVANYRFIGWTAANPEDLALLGEDLSLLATPAFIMPARNLAFTALFEPIEYSLTLLVKPAIISEPAGAIAEPSNPHGTPYHYHAGEVISMSVMPLEGYDFAGWETGNPLHQEFISEPHNMATNFTMPGGNVTITATYTLTKYTIGLLIKPDALTADAKPQVQLLNRTGGDPGIFYMGDEVELRVEEVPGYTFTAWTSDDPETLLLLNGNTGVVSPPSFIMPARNLVFTAEYAIIPPTFSIAFVVMHSDTSPITGATITLNSMAYDAGTYLFTGLEPGNYTYTVSMEGYFPVEGTVQITDTDVTQPIVLLIDDTGVAVFAQPNLNVFPNPASSYVTVQGDNELHHITIIDINGRIVHDAPTRNPNTCQIDISKLSPGNYILQITTTDKKHITRKLSIN